MARAKHQRLAVLMGDIVGSEAAPSAASVHRPFNKAVAWANQRYRSHIASPLTITLGDEFQGLVRTSARAWAVASDLRLKLMKEGIACRFVVGLAAIETSVNSEQAWNMMGPGLAAARGKLNDKASRNAHRFSFPDDPALELLADAVGESITHIELDWTEKQRDYVLRTRLDGQTPASIAKSRKVSAGAVYKVLRAAGSDYYDRQSEAIRNSLTILDTRHNLE